MGALALLVGFAGGVCAASAATLYPIPAEVSSTHYVVTIDGQRTPVVHAASNYYLLNFDTDGPVTVAVTADDPYFWDAGVEIQPMRLGIRPSREGRTIRFRLDGPQKLSISRPGDHFAEADMLFLFANEREHAHIGPGTPGVRYYAPGVHRGSIDAHSGETIYLAGGAVIFGSLNLWQVHDVRVLGRGMIVYDGPQNPEADEGWMHKPDWHVIVMDNAENIEINGITTVVRSRTWQIQMKDSHHIGFYNVKAVAGLKGDANQDGMDWLGGGDTTVRNSFLRASDDVFAAQGNWEGYSDEAMLTPGHDVANITIADTVASTSISNTVRVAWPQKIFSSAHFHMRNVDVLHTGFGDCKVPFAFFELWADPGGVGTHTDYTFEDIRLEDWYSLYQIRYPNPSVSEVHFSGVWSMDGPGMVAAAVKGAVKGVTVEDGPANEGGPTEVLDGAAATAVAAAAWEPGFAYTPGLLRARAPVTFTAAAEEAPGRRFEWLFGDGTRAEGRVVRHAFVDDQGTLLDGSGRFRVLLHTREQGGSQSWKSESVVLAGRVHASGRADMRSAEEQAAAPGMVRMERRFVVPADGGYTVTVLTDSEGTVALDDMAPVSSPKPRARACGSDESAMQPTRVSAAMRAGPHQLHLTVRAGLKPVVLWEGPGVERQVLPAQ
ncbi:MAG TPA: hypothetical protein VGD62_12765 [Acidobacteriaceae bacterium]